MPLVITVSLLVALDSETCRILASPMRRVPEFSRYQNKCQRIKRKMSYFAPLLPRSPLSFMDNHSIFIRNMWKRGGTVLNIFVLCYS